MRVDAARALGLARRDSQQPAVVEELALRLQRVLRQSDTAGRLGGDEFALVLPSTDEAGAVKVAEKLIKVLEPSFKVGDKTLKSACSIGIAVYPEHGKDVATLCKSADMAMYASKHRNIGYSVYRPKD